MVKTLLGLSSILVVGSSDAYSVASNAIRAILALLSVWIYNLIIVVYNLFEVVATAEILNNAMIDEMYKKIGLLLGLFMLFKLTFSFVKMVVNPDLITDKEKGVGKVITRSVIALVLLGLTPTIFKEAFKIQRIVMDNNVIGKLLSVSTVGSSKDFGLDLSENLFFTFYKDEYDPYLDIDPDFEKLKSEIEETNSFNPTKKYLNDSDGGFTNVYLVEFDGLLSVVVGGIVLWMLFVYCLNVGVRVVQLAFYQLIAPIPVLSYISDKKDGLFSRWLKQCGMAYLDLFIRVAIINFVIMLTQIIMENKDSISITDMNDAAKIVIILGLLTFAMRAPELLKELIPGAKDSKFGIGFKNVPEGAQRAAGVLAGTAVGLGTGAFTGDVLGGARRGLITGAKKGNILKNLGEVNKNQRAINKKRVELLNNGGSFGGARVAGLANTFGLNTAADTDKNKLAKMKFFTDNHKSLEDRSLTKALEKNIMVRGNDGNLVGIADLKNRVDTLRASAANISEESIRKELSEQGVPASILTSEMLQEEATRRRCILNSKIYAADSEYNTHKKAARVEYINQVSKGDINDIETTRMVKYYDSGIDKYRSVAKSNGLSKVGTGNLTIDEFSKNGDMSTATSRFENSDEVTRNKANADFGNRK